MKHYVMMTNEDFNALPTATTQIYFQQHGNEDCKRYFLDKDFSFNKLSTKLFVHYAREFS